MWAQIINTIIGLWLMAAPAILGYSGPANTNQRIVGPIAVSFAVIACWEVTRQARWTNLVLGVWLIVAPLVLSHETSAGITSIASGVLLALFSLVRGRYRPERFGGGWSALWKRDALEAKQTDNSRTG
jgi:hypothetical protein